MAKYIVDKSVNLNLSAVKKSVWEKPRKKLNALPIVKNGCISVMMCGRFRREGVIDLILIQVIMKKEQYRLILHKHPIASGLHITRSHLSKCNTMNLVKHYNFENNNTTLLFRIRKCLYLYGLQFKQSRADIRREEDFLRIYKRTSLADIKRHPDLTSKPNCLFWVSNLKSPNPKL